MKTPVITAAEAEIFFQEFRDMNGFNTLTEGIISRHSDTFPHVEEYWADMILMAAEAINGTPDE